MKLQKFIKLVENIPTDAHDRYGIWHSLTPAALENTRTRETKIGKHLLLVVQDEGGNTISYSLKAKTEGFDTTDVEGIDIWEYRYKIMEFFEEMLFMEYQEGQNNDPDSFECYFSPGRGRDHEEFLIKVTCIDYLS